MTTYGRPGVVGTFTGVIMNMCYELLINYQSLSFFEYGQWPATVTPRVCDWLRSKTYRNKALLIEK